MYRNNNKNVRLTKRHWPTYNTQRVKGVERRYSNVGPEKQYAPTPIQISRDPPPLLRTFTPTPPYTVGIDTKMPPHCSAMNVYLKLQIIQKINFLIHPEAFTKEMFIFKIMACINYSCKIIYYISENTLLNVIVHDLLS